MTWLTAGVLFLFSVANAAVPSFWTFSSQADFIKGKFENISISNDGRLTLSRQSDLIFETNASFVWSSAVHDESLWIGTGSNGQVFRLGIDGTNELVFDASEENVHAIYPIDFGNVVVGSSPDGAGLQNFTV